MTAGIASMLVTTAEAFKYQKAHAQIATHAMKLHVF